MVKHFCNMCGKEIAKDDRYPVYARCQRLHIDHVSLDFCAECVKYVYGEDVIAEARTAFEARQKRIAERKAKVRIAENAD